MHRGIFLALAGLSLVAAAALPLRADYPQPSPYPISWELTSDFSAPKRIVVQGPGDVNPNAYWYITYHVSNNTDQDTVLFYPNFQMLMEDGQIIHSDIGVAPAVFDAIKKKEGLKFLQSDDLIGGDLRQGEDQSKDGVAIWPEPRLRMGTFTIFIAGYWGEAATVTINGKDITLHKTEQITYSSDSDEQHPGGGDLIEKSRQFVMR